MKSWAKLRAEMSLESQARIDTRLEEALTDPADNPRLAAEESELRGSWVIDATGGISEDPVCQRIQALVKNHLQLVATSSDGWRKLFRDAGDQRYWALSYPQGEMHGGGPPTLHVVPDPSLW